MASSGTHNVAPHVLQIAVKAVTETPGISAKQLHEQLPGYSLTTAKNALTKAREAITKETDQLTSKAARLQERRQREALRALESQLDELQNDPPIIQALTRETFEIDEITGQITGIKERIKGYNKEGDPIYLTPASIVKEYLEARKLMVDQERLISGIEAAEQAGIASAGKTEINLAFVPSDPGGIRPVSNR